MTRLSIQGVTGSVVLVAGLVALGAVTTPEQPSSDSPIPAEVSESLSIDGLDPAVQRILESYEFVHVLTFEEMAEIPASVIRTLRERGVVLTVAPGGGR